jgi:KTSC domain
MLGVRSMGKWTQNVYSSMAQDISYDSETEEMIVTWNSGRVSSYSGVPEETAQSAANAASVGEFINSEIKGKFSHRYVR